VILFSSPLFRIAKELGEKNLSSTNVIYVARKVAMLAETRRKLIDNGVLQFLIKYRVKYPLLSNLKSPQPRLSDIDFTHERFL